MYVSMSARFLVHWRLYVDMSNFYKLIQKNIVLVFILFINL